MRLQFASIVLMAVVVTFAGSSSAQTTTEPAPVLTVPSSISTEFHNMATHYGKVKSGALRIVKGARGEITTNAVAPQYTIGWNIVHLANCLGFSSGGTYWLYAYADDGSYYYTATPGAQTLLAQQCSTGNYTGFYVTDSSGTWTQLFTWTFK